MDSNTINHLVQIKVSLILLGTMSLLYYLNLRNFREKIRKGYKVFGLICYGIGIILNIFLWVIDK